MAKNFRQLQIFYDLLNGARLQKTDLVQQFEVSPRAIQRDISELNVFLADTSAHQSIVHTDAGYQLVSEQHELTPREVLVLIKVLLASRALNKQELNSTLRGLLQLIKTSDRKAVEPIIKNEAFFYEPVHHHQNLLNSLWDFSQAIRQKRRWSLPTSVATSKRSPGQFYPRPLSSLNIIFTWCPTTKSTRPTSSTVPTVSRATLPLIPLSPVLALTASKTASSASASSSCIPAP